jgi:hypothetical protein
LVNPTDPEGYQTVRDVEAAAGQQILIHEVSTGRDIDAAFASIASENADALLVGPGTFFNTRRVCRSLDVRARRVPDYCPPRAASPDHAQRSESDRAMTSVSDSIHGKVNFAALSRHY